MLFFHSSPRSILTAAASKNNTHLLTTNILINWMNVWLTGCWDRVFWLSSCYGFLYDLSYINEFDLYITACFSEYSSVLNNKVVQTKVTECFYCYCMYLKYFCSMYMYLSILIKNYYLGIRLYFYLCILTTISLSLCLFLPLSLKHWIQMKNEWQQIKIIFSTNVPP